MHKPTREILKERGEAALFHAIAQDDRAMGRLCEEAARQVKSVLGEVELSPEEQEIIYAQRGAGHFEAEIADVRLGYFGEEKPGPGIHFTVSVIEHPLKLHDYREIPCSFSAEAITRIIEEVSYPEQAGA